MTPEVDIPLEDCAKHALRLRQKSLRIDASHDFNDRSKNLRDVSNFWSLFSFKVGGQRRKWEQADGT